jgi:hypothetical protein
MILLMTTYLGEYLVWTKDRIKVIEENKDNRGQVFQHEFAPRVNIDPFVRT